MYRLKLWARDPIGGPGEELSHGPGPRLSQQLFGLKTQSLKPYLFMSEASSGALPVLKYLGTYVPTRTQLITSSGDLMPA